MGGRSSDLYLIFAMIGILSTYTFCATRLSLGAYPSNRRAGSGDGKIKRDHRRLENLSPSCRTYADGQRLSSKWYYPPQVSRAWSVVCLTLDDVVDLDDLRRARKLYPIFGQDRHESRTERLELLS
jgi:hypothetical protein